MTFAVAVGTQNDAALNFCGQAVEAIGLPGNVELFSRGVGMVEIQRAPIGLAAVRALAPLFNLPQKHLPCARGVGCHGDLMRKGVKRLSRFCITAVGTRARTIC